MNEFLDSELTLWMRLIIQVFFWNVCCTVTFESSYYIVCENRVAVGESEDGAWCWAMELGCLLSCQDALLVVEPDNMTVHLSWFHGLCSYLLTFLLVTDYYILIRVPLMSVCLWFESFQSSDKVIQFDSLKDWCQSLHLTDLGQWLTWVSSFTSVCGWLLPLLIDVSCFSQLT